VRGVGLAPRGSRASWQRRGASLEEGHAGTRRSEARRPPEARSDDRVGVLQRVALAVVQNLVSRRLPYVEERLALQMMRTDLSEITTGIRSWWPMSAPPRQLSPEVCSPNNTEEIGVDLPPLPLPATTHSFQHLNYGHWQPFPQPFTQFAHKQSIFLLRKTSDPLV
jgi:hypothetical protein